MPRVITFPFQHRRGLGDQLGSHRVRASEIGVYGAGIMGADQMVFEFGKQQAERAEQAGKRRYDDLGYAEFGGHIKRVSRAHTAESNQHETPGITTAFG